MAPVARNKNLKLQELLFAGFDFPPPSVAPQPATGLITCVSNANMADTDYITIGDGIGAAVLYEYDKAADGVTGGRTSWAAGASTASNVATTLAAAINATQKTLSATANGADGAGTVRVTHRWPGAGGNVTITENVANAGFLVAGMTGGRDASATLADTTVKQLPLIAAAELIDAQIVCPAAMATSDSDYVVVKLMNGSTVMASWSTKLTGGNGALTSSFQTMTPATALDDRRGALGDTLSLFVDVTGSPTVPALRVATHLRYRSAPKA